MAQILLLTDRPQADEQVTAFAVELAHQLKHDGLSAIVARHRHTVLSTSLFPGTLDGGLLPQTVPLVVTEGGVDTQATRRLFTVCHQSAAFYGVRCETARANLSLAGTAAALASLDKLLIFSRETLQNSIADQSSPVFNAGLTAPLLICPTAPERWQRVVVIARNDARRESLMAWGRHWSDCCDVPMTVMDPGLMLSGSFWSKLTRWLPGASRVHRRRVLQKRLQDCDLQPCDLLVIDRQPVRWSLTSTTDEVLLDDLIAATCCAIAVTPANFCPSVWQVPCSTEVECVA